MLAILISYKRRMIVFSIGMAFFLCLYSVQALFISLDLAVNNSVIYLTHEISRNGFFLALCFLFALSWCLLALSLLSPALRSKFVNANKRRSKSEGHICFATIFFVFLLSYLWVFEFTGWEIFVSSSRPGIITGSTIFLVAISIGLLPLLIDLIHRGRSSLIHCLLALFVLFQTSLFSRIHVIAYIEMILVAWFYSNGINLRRIGIRESLVLGSSFVALLFVFFGIGAIRDALLHVPPSASGIIDFLAKTNSGVLSLRYNYTVSVEGMSGLAGAFTVVANTGEISGPLDWGISMWVRGIFFQWIPGSIKFYLADFNTYFWEEYWYQRSIVPSGVESSFVSFGWLGIPVFALMYLYLSNNLSRLFIKSSRIYLKIVLLLLIGMNVFFVRGSWFVWIGFTISYLLVWTIYYHVFIRRIRTYSVSGGRDDLN